MHGHLHAATTTSSRLMFDLDPSSIYFFEPDFWNQEFQFWVSAKGILNLLNCDIQESWLGNWSALAKYGWHDGPGCTDIRAHCAISWRKTQEQTEEATERICLSSEVVALKSIRVDGKMRPFLNAWRSVANFAVIHILRDARGFVASYLHEYATNKKRQSFVQWHRSDPDDVLQKIQARLAFCAPMQDDLNYTKLHYAKRDGPPLILLNTESFLHGGESAETCVVDDVRALLGLQPLSAISSTRLPISVCDSAGRAHLRSGTRYGDISWEFVARAVPQFESLVLERCPDLNFFNQLWTLRTYGQLDSSAWPKSPPSQPPPEPSQPPPASPSPPALPPTLPPAPPFVPPSRSPPVWPPLQPPIQPSLLHQFSCNPQQQITQFLEASLTTHLGVTFVFTIITVSCCTLICILCRQRVIVSSLLHTKEGKTQKRHRAHRIATTDIDDPTDIL